MSWEYDRRRRRGVEWLRARLSPFSRKTRGGRVEKKNNNNFSPVKFMAVRRQVQCKTRNTPRDPYVTDFKTFLPPWPLSFVIVPAETTEKLCYYSISFRLRRSAFVLAGPSRYTRFYNIINVTPICSSLPSTYVLYYNTTCPLWRKTRNNYDTRRGNDFSNGFGYRPRERPDGRPGTTSIISFSFLHFLDIL